jgi:signal transduction histidine kinase
MTKSLRVQLAAWYLAFFLVLFLTFCLVLYGSISKALERRLEETLSATASISAELLMEELDEMEGEAAAAAEEVISKMQPRRSVIAIVENGKLVAVSDPEQKPEIESAASLMVAVDSQDGVWKLPHWRKNGARASARRFDYQDRTYFVLAVEPLDSIVQSLQALRETLWLVTPLLLALAGAGGYLVTRRRLAPLGSMVEQTRTITGQNLERRLRIGNAAEELTVLAASFNELLSRLDQSFEGMRRFVQDASHELRTPLAVIRGEADVALSQERSTAEYKESLAIIQEESRRLSRLVDDLLNLARADAGHVQLHVEELYLNELLSECCRSVHPLAAARNIELECRSGEDVAVQGDEELLRRMVVNLLDNAIRYTPPGGGCGL